MTKRKILAIVAILPLLAVGCAMTPPADDPVLLKLNELERRLSAIERMLASGSIIDLTIQTDELQQRTRELQGRIETLEHDATGALERQRELYADLDMRIQNLERLSLGSTGRFSFLDGGSLTPGQLPVPGGSDRDNHQSACELPKEQHYIPAWIACEHFCVRYPDSQIAAHR